MRIVALCHWCGKGIRIAPGESYAVFPLTSTTDGWPPGRAVASAWPCCADCLPQVEASLLRAPQG